MQGIQNSKLKEQTNWCLEQCQSEDQKSSQKKLYYKMLNVTVIQGRLRDQCHT